MFSRSSTPNTTPATSTTASVISMDAPKSNSPAPGPVSEVDKGELSSKIRMLLGILRKFIGVADIAAVRFSLPTQLLEPQPNLEYWNYLDRPEAFASIDDADDELGRMLNVLRFWFTKDLKYVKGRPCKPYNSILGEFFRCSWNIEKTLGPVTQPGGDQSKAVHAENAVEDDKDEFADATEVQEPTGAPPAVSRTTSSKGVKVVYLTEQTSHHPPISAFWIECPEKGITARGYDQLSAKFTGASIRVSPGSENLGIFVNLKNRGDEEYQLTHPVAFLGGLLRGTLNVSIAETAYFSCPKTKIKVILQYIEERWIGKMQNKVEGVIYTYDPESDNYSKVKDVPESVVIGKISGSWVDKIYVTLTKTSPPQELLLIDLNPLELTIKTCPPEDQQLANESRTQWAGVTNAIHSKEFSQATNLKVDIEEKQRQRAAKREQEGRKWTPRYFIVREDENPGRPRLTEKGRKALDGLSSGEFKLEPDDNEE